MAEPPRTGRPRIPLGRRLAYGAAVPLVLLAAAEATVRLVDPEPPSTLLRAPLGHAFPRKAETLFRDHPRLFWELRPELDVEGSVQGDRTDALGLRNASAPRPAPPGAGRIVCMGDSCTYGLGVPLEQAWPARLAARTGREVVNAGVPGYTTHQGLAQWDLRLADLGADVVVVQFGPNDRTPWPTRVGDELAFLTDRERARHVAFSLRPFGSALLGWLRAAVATPAPERRPADATEETLRASRPRVPPDEFVENLRALCGKAPRAVLVVWPARMRFERPAEPGVAYARMLEYDALVRRVAREDGRPLVDLEDHFARSGLPVDAIYADGIHATARGNELVAEAVAGALGAANGDDGDDDR